MSFPTLIGNPGFLLVIQVVAACARAPISSDLHCESRAFGAGRSNLPESSELFCLNRDDDIDKVAAIDVQ